MTAEERAKCVPYRLRIMWHIWARYPCDGGFYPYAWSAGMWVSSHLFYDRIDAIIEFRGGFREMTRIVFYAINWWVQP